MAIDDTWGGRTADAYITEVRATSYIATAHVFADEWLAATLQQREAALRRATMHIDSRNWHGSRFFYFQALEFPRHPPGEGFWYPSRRGEPDDGFLSLVEQDEYLRKQRLRVERACCEQAVFVLRNAGRLGYREDQYHGIRSVGRGMRMSESLGYGEPDMVLCPEAWDLLRYYRASPRIVRGDARGSSRWGE